LLTHLRGACQRRRGQTDAGSWAAFIVARICGAVIFVLIALSSTATPGATAATRGHASDPAPQKAPTSSSSSQPAPDPAPQANSTSPAPHRSTITSPAIRQPVVTTPTRTVVVAPARTVSAPATRTVASSPRTVASSRPPTHPARVTAPARVPAHRAASPRHTRSQATPLSFPLALPRDLLLLPGAALREGTTGHRNGVLLLLSSVAMAVVAVASFALFRRLRRLELR
jgi:hypothetical protein